MAWTWYEAEVKRMESVSVHTRRFWIEVEGEGDFSFKPGQFITLDLPIAEKRTERWRSYSIANPPRGGRELELCISDQGGPASRYFFEEVGPGTSLRFKGPSGVFVLPSDLPEELVMVCTGTGVAPFRSMIWHLYDQGYAGKVHLIFGTRYAWDILYRREFEVLQEDWPNFRYDVVLSRDESWQGRRGHVHQVYLEYYAQPKPHRLMMLCGWKPMIDEARQHLNELGYAKEQIAVELYG